jgi:hypothetical protein
LSLAFAGRAKEAEPIATQAEALAIQTLGPDHDTTLLLQHDLAIVVWYGGDSDRAATMLREIFPHFERVNGPFHESTVHALRHLVEILADSGRSDGALPPWTRRYSAGVGALTDSGRTDEALPLALDAVDRAIRANSGNPCSIGASSSIGMVNILLRRRGDFAALRDFQQDLIRKVLAIPIEPGDYLRGRRVTRLEHGLKELAILPDDVPIDTDLAARAGEEVVRLSNGRAGCVTFALLFDRSGRIDLALESLEKAKADPDWTKSEDEYTRLVEALIRARRGELAEARRLYDEARKRPTFGPYGDQPYEPLRRRVEALLADAEGGPTHQKSRKSPRGKAAAR